MYCTIVLGCPRRADAKNGVKNYQGSQENAMPNYSYSPYTFFKVVSDYDLNLGRCLNPELTPMRSLASLYFLNCHTFVCGSLFPGIKLN
jgi:hypothetical protein